MKKKLLKIGSLLSLVLIPVLVLADDIDDMGVIGVLMMHLMLSLHSAGFLCLPSSLIFGVDSAAQKTIFWRVFWIRAVVVVILTFIAPTASIVVDVASIFIGGFIGFPIVGVVSSIRGKKNKSIVTTTSKVNLIEAKCTKCGSVIKPGQAFCTECGLKIPSTISSVVANQTISSLPLASQGKQLRAANIFGYNMTEDQMLEEIIKREMKKSGETNNVSIAAVEKKKNIFSIVYAIILFISVSLFFFHSYTGVLVVVFLVATIIYINSVKNYNIYKYLQKEVKSRPDEKIGYIVSTVLEGKVRGSSKLIRLAFLLVAVGVPLFIFRTPHVIYEQDATLDGYVIRFYTIGWLENDSTLEIPAEYKGEPVVGIRGDVFANVHTLEKVVLPDTIKEIRGGAFKNASRLEEINLPEGIPEIKGETFQECVSLKEITIPDSVTRIGGHAFRDNHSLKKVEISANSQLQEIGSSAFRNCYELEEIYLPRDINVNEKAFKDSGTKVREYTEDGKILNGKEDFKYNKKITFKLNEKKDLSYDHIDTLTKGRAIKFAGIEEDYGLYTYLFNIYGSNGGTHGIILYDISSFYIDYDYNIALEIENTDVFYNYSDTINLVVYYN